MSYHWFKKMLLSTSILILSSSSLGLATHTVEAKDNLNGEKPTTNLNHNITSPSVNSEMNNNETGTPHESNQTGNEGTGSNSRDANPDSNNVKPDSNNQNRIQNQIQINQSQIRIQNQTLISQILTRHQIPINLGIQIILVARKMGEHGTQMLQMDLIKVNGNQMGIKETHKILLVMILYPNDF
ncbi:hypothetical protein Q219_02609 [Staphylococcus aureus M1227]|nr:hypothetical protein Q219_02609 [Staphylococcus aureus M1227]